MTGTQAASGDDPARMEAATAAALPQMPTWDATSIEAARNSPAARALRPPTSDPRVVSQDEVIEGTSGNLIPLRWYRPVSESTPGACIVWLHSGGYIIGSLDSTHVRAQQIAAESGCVVLSIGWRLAPEHPYPAGLQDSVDVWKWLHANAERLGIDSGRIVLSGASAGGGVAAATCLRLRELGLEQPALQLLVYPMLDDRPTPSMSAVTHPALWNRDMNRLGWTAYLSGLGAGPVPDTAVPARAENLGGLAPAYICVGDIDGFFDEDVTYAQRLARHGVPVELRVYPGVFHGGFSASGAPKGAQMFADAVRAFRDAADSLEVVVAPVS